MRRPFSLQSCAVLLALNLIGCLAAAQTFTVLYSFTDGADGGEPVVGLTRDSAGNFYGTTTNGGDLTCRAPFGCGTLFKLDPAGNLSVLKNFRQNTLISDLAIDSQGNLYGTTSNEGDAQKGDVYKVDQSGVETVLYSFNTTFPAPEAGVTLGGAGNIFGTTYDSVFRLSSSGKFTNLHVFDVSDGYGSRGDLIRDPGGSLYGTTAYGGANDEGTVFQIDSKGNFTSLHSFTAGPDARPLAGVIRDAAGNLYGTTESSYDSTNKCIRNGGCGSVFKLDAAGNETVLHIFTGGTDGTFPMGSLLRDAAGTLYGTAFRGGAKDKGTIFEVKANGQFQVLYSFQAGVDGMRPRGRLLRDSAGNLYGTSEFGGEFQKGCIYKLSPK